MKKPWHLVLAVAAVLSFIPAASFANFDNCTKAGGFCMCDNSKKAGTCGPGSLKPGLYCHCDKPMTNHDGCGQQNQGCTCSNTGWKGKCDVGPLKDGLYCHCGAPAGPSPACVAACQNNDPCVKSCKAKGFDPLGKDKVQCGCASSVDACIAKCK